MDRLIPEGIPEAYGPSLTPIGPRAGGIVRQMSQPRDQKESANKMHDHSATQDRTPMQEKSTVTRRSLRIQGLSERIPWFTGLPILAVMTVVLFGLAAQQAWIAHPATGAATTLIVALLLLTLLREAQTLSEIEPSTLVSAPAFYNFTGVVGGALTTFVLSVDLGLGAVVAAGVIGLLGALIFPEQGVPIYCGAFVGMVSPDLLNSLPHVMLAAVIAGLVFVLSTGVLDGFGGKLGTIAFTGTVVAPLLLQCEFCPADVPPVPVAWQIMATSVAAGVGTYWVSITLGHGAVVGSSVVGGVVAGLLLPAVLPETGPLLAVVAICASFTGMSSPKRIPNYLWMTLASVATGIVFIYTQPVLGGAGGKLGTIAFGSAMFAFTVKALLNQIRVRD